MVNLKSRSEREALIENLNNIIGNLAFSLPNVESTIFKYITNSLFTALLSLQNWSIISK
jgi:hypothetical protein